MTQYQRRWWRRGAAAYNTNTGLRQVTRRANTIAQRAYHEGYADAQRRMYAR